MSEYERTIHRFFDPLVAFLCNYTCVTFTLNVQRGGNAGRFKGGDRVGFLCATGDCTLVFDVGPLMKAVAKEDWVKRISYELHPLVKPEELPKNVIRKTGRVHDIATQALFGQYFAGVETLVSRNHRNALMRFAKAVRNACAHGGQFTRLDDRAELDWRGLRLASADNGRSVFDVGLSRGDLLLLMAEIDDHLPR